MNKILLVEDDGMLVKLYKDKLEKSGYNIDTAVTVDEALRALSENKYGLILLDIMLPGGKNGFDFLEIVEKNPEYKKIPVIVITNLDSEAKPAREIGAKDYLIKSNITLDVLIDRIKNNIV